MELRDWVQERFGTADTETLLDESAYGQNELRSDKKKLEQGLKQLESDMDTHSKKYQKLLEKGAEADEMRRRQYAQKAKFEKKKYEIKKKNTKPTASNSGRSSLSKGCVRSWICTKAKTSVSTRQ